jgi:hypothetical protein
MQWTAFADRLIYAKDVEGNFRSTHGKRRNCEPKKEIPNKMDAKGKAVLYSTLKTVAVPVLDLCQ